LTVLIACQTSAPERRPQLGATYLGRHPSSPFRDRVARACEVASPSPPESTTNLENAVER
jgi:hypothetical protein